MRKLLASVIALVLGFSASASERQVGETTVAAQDKAGFIWSGSRSGLDRFDGYRYKHYDLSDQKSSLANSVTAICCTEDGSLWVGSRKGLYRYDAADDSFVRFMEMTDSDISVFCGVNSIVESGRDTVMIGTNGQGLFVYDCKTGGLEQHIRHESMVYVIAEGPDGNYLIGSEEGTVSEVSPDGHYVRTLITFSGNKELRDVIITSILYHADHVWVCMGQNGFFRMGRDGSDPEFFKPDWMNSQLNATGIAVQPDGNALLVTSDAGIYTFDFVSERFLPEYIDHPVNHLFFDRDRNLWESSVNDGLKMVNPEVSSIKVELRNCNISAICQDYQGRLWIGTSYEGLLCYPDGDMSSPAVKVDIPDIRSVCSYGDRMLVGTGSYGMYEYFIGSKRLVNYRHDRYDQSSISDNTVRSIYVSDTGRVFVGTDWGLNYFDPDKGTFRYEPRSTNTSSINCILQDSRRNIWMATRSDGLYLVGPAGRRWNAFKHADAPDTVLDNNVTALAEAPDGTVWMATSAGLCFYDYSDARFHEKLFGGRPLYDIHSLAFDVFGHLWATSKSMILCLDVAKGQVIQTIDSMDEITFSMFGERASAVLDGGRIIFGGFNGCVSFIPELFGLSRVDRRHMQRPILFTDIRVNHTEQVSGKRLRLPYKKNTLTVEFSDLDYASAGSKLYSVKVDGRDNDWSEPSPSTSVMCSRLRPGRYVINVRTIGTDASGSVKEASLPVVIRPPFMLSWWAYMVYISLAIFSVYSWFRFRQRRLAEKTAEDKVSFFTNITHEIRTPLTLIKAPLEKIIASGDGTEQTKGYLSMIDRNANALLDLVNQLLDYRKVQDGNFQLNLKPCDVMLTLVDICGRFSVLAEMEHKSFELVSDDSSRGYTYELDADAVTKIFNNLISNAVKYAATRVVVTSRLEPESLSVTVSNDGSMIPANEREEIFRMFYQIKGSKVGTGIGLPLSRMLAEKHGGTIEVTSSEESTDFTLVIPARRSDPVESEPLLAPEIERVVADEEPESPELGAKPDILLVDDNEDLRLLIQEILKTRYSVTQASNGKEAMEILDRQAFDLILCDVAMPDMDGYQLCEYVKSDLRYNHIPFIHISAKTALDDKIKGLEFGADDYIEKPFSPDLLMAKIRSTLENRRLQKEFFQGLPIVHPTKVAGITKGNVEFIQKMNDTIDQNLSNENYGVEDLASALFMSQSSLYRKVKNLTDMSPNDYVKNYRLKKAAEMLSSGDYLANEVFQKVGFSSQSYFSICFKKKFGMSPVKYVESVKGDDR